MYTRSDYRRPVSLHKTCRSKTEDIKVNLCRIGYVRFQLPAMIRRCVKTSPSIWLLKSRFTCTHWYRWTELFNASLNTRNFNSRLPGNLKRGSGALPSRVQFLHVSGSHPLEEKLIICRALIREIEVIRFIVANFWGTIMLLYSWVNLNQKL